MSHRSPTLGRCVTGSRLDWSQRVGPPGSVSVLASIDVLLAATHDDATATRRRLDALADPLPSALTYTGAPGGLADLIGTWAVGGAVDGFVIRSATLPATLTHLVDEVVPLLQQRDLFRRAYSGSTLRNHFGLDRPINIYAGTATAGPR